MSLPGFRDAIPPSSPDRNPSSLDSPRDPTVHPIAPRITNAQSVTDGEISWAQRFSMKEFEIDHFRLQFEIENAMLYSFSFGN
jgi:hypothetical protein